MKPDSLDLLELYNLVKLVKIRMILIKVTIVKLLLVLLLFLRDDPWLVILTDPLLRLLYPLDEVRLLGDRLIPDLLLLLAFLILLLLTPWHDDLEDGLALICKVSQIRHSFLQQ